MRYTTNSLVTGLLQARSHGCHILRNASKSRHRILGVPVDGINVQRVDVHRKPPSLQRAATRRTESVRVESFQLDPFGGQGVHVGRGHLLGLIRPVITQVTVAEIIAQNHNQVRLARRRPSLCKRRRENAEQKELVECAPPHHHLEGAAPKTMATADVSLQRKATEKRACCANGGAAATARQGAGDWDCEVGSCLRPWHARSMG